MSPLLAYLLGCASTGFVLAGGILVSDWLGRRGRRKQLPPATRRQIDRAARANRPKLRDDKRGWSVDDIYDEDTHP